MLRYPVIFISYIIISERNVGFLSKTVYIFIYMLHKYDTQFGLREKMEIRYVCVYEGMYVFMYACMYVKSDHKIVGLKINKHAAWNFTALNKIKSR